MKKVINCLVILQLLIFLTGCCCPCGKKPASQPSEPQEQQPSETEETE